MPTPLAITDVSLTDVTATEMEDGTVRLSLGLTLGAVRPPASPAPTGPSVRDTTTGTGVAGTRAIDLPTRVAGDTLVAVVANDGAANPAANTGWTRRASNDDGISVAIATYVRQSDGTDNVPVNSNLSGDYTYTVFAVRDVTAGHDAAASASSGGAPGASIAAPSVTTAAAPALLVSAYVMSAAGTITPPGDQTPTVPVAVAGHTLRCAYESLAAAGATGTRTAIGSNAGATWAAASEAVK
ncbi:MAG TPA: hypothetical protein VD866_08085 [Urbifossiella sp.]|nr:hypothetical protein [Urbifossiella sp.]